MKIEINSKINIKNSDKNIYNNINETNIQAFTYEDYLKYEKYKKGNNFIECIEDIVEEINNT